MVTLFPGLSLARRKIFFVGARGEPGNKAKKVDGFRQGVLYTLWLAVEKSWLALGQ